MEKQKVYSIRKLKNGVASVAIATAFFALGTSQVSAEELQSVSEMTVEQELIPSEPEEEIVAEEEIIEANAEIVDGASGEDESEVVEVNVNEEEQMSKTEESNEIDFFDVEKVTITNELVNETPKSIQSETTSEKKLEDKTEDSLLIDLEQSESDVNKVADEEKGVELESLLDTSEIINLNVPSEISNLSEEDKMSSFEFEADGNYSQVKIVEITTDKPVYDILEEIIFTVVLDSEVDLGNTEASFYFSQYYQDYYMGFNAFIENFEKNSEGFYVGNTVVKIPLTTFGKSEHRIYDIMLKNKNALPEEYGEKLSIPYEDRNYEEPLFIIDSFDTSDRTGPEIIKISTSQDTYKPNDIIDVIIELFDESGIEEAEVSFYSNVFTWLHTSTIKDFRMNEQGNYVGIGKIKVPELLLSRYSPVYKPELLEGINFSAYSVVSYDTYGNASLIDYINESKSADANFKVVDADLHVTQISEDTYKSGPMINGISLDKTQYEPGDKVNISIDVWSFNLPMEYIELKFNRYGSNQSDDVHVFNAIFKSFEKISDEQYRGYTTIEIPDYTVNDHYKVFEALGSDILGQEINQYSFRYESFGQRPYDFEVINAKDRGYEVSEILEITLDKEIYEPNEEIKVTLVVSNYSEFKSAEINANNPYSSKYDKQLLPSLIINNFTLNSDGNYVGTGIIKIPHKILGSEYVAFVKMKDIYGTSLPYATEWNHGAVRFLIYNFNGTREESRIEPVEYEINYIDNPELPEETEKLVKEGKPGQVELLENVTYEDHVVTNREKVSENILLQPVTQIIERGTRVTEVKSETRTEEVAFETIYQDNNNLDIGTEKVVAAGVDGVRTIVESVTYVNGKETNRVISSTNITTDPISRVIERGTRVTEVKRETRNEEIPFEIVYKENPELAEGEMNILTPGVTGTRVVVEEVTYVNGILTERVVISSEVTTEAINQVIEIAVPAEETPV